MATAISRRVSIIRVVAVNRAIVGIEEERENAAVEISWINRWPAVRLAVSRTPRARGRMNKLIVSMMIRIGIRGVGVPSGRRCPRACVGWFRIPMITVASHRGVAMPRFKESCVVGVKVYGSKPNKFRETRKIIKEASKVAHLCPSRFKGRRSCWVNRLINHAWRESKRLFNHRVEGAGNINQGREIARAARGIPRYEGLINWSKRLTVMVRLRSLFGVF